MTDCPRPGENLPLFKVSLGCQLFIAKSNLDLSKVIHVCEVKWLYWATKCVGQNVPIREEITHHVHFIF